MRSVSGNQVPGLMLRAAKLVTQNPGEASLLLRMAGWIGLLSVLVKLRPLPKALSVIAAPLPITHERQTDTENRLAASIDSLLRAKLLCFRPVCWKRAAVLHRYLALNGIATRIVFGMKKDADGTVRGHAWLEADGQPILETTEPDYTVTYTFPSREKFPLEISLLNDQTATPKN